MNRATLKDAPAVLNTNDRAMWVVGFNAALEAQGAPTPAQPVAWRYPIGGGRYAATTNEDDARRASTDGTVDALAILAAGIQPAPAQGEIGNRYSVEFDGFTGTVIGTYKRLDGEDGVVMQQDGCKVVHVYRRKWLKPAATPPSQTIHSADTQGLAAAEGDSK